MRSDVEFRQHVHYVQRHTIITRLEHETDLPRDRVPLGGAALGLLPSYLSGSLVASGSNQGGKDFWCDSG